MTSNAKRVELLEEVRDASEGVRGLLRERAKTDVFFLGKGILGYPDIDKAVHGPIARFLLEKTLRRMVLYPRGHLKTTLATIIDSIRLVLLDPNERILIANEVLQNAMDILFEIKGHFEKDQDNLLRALFPELVPTRFQGPGVTWNTLAASIVRSGNYKESTFMAIGVGGAVTSKHFTRIKCDDLTGLEAYRSKASLKEAIQWFNNLEALVTGSEETIIDFIGTRWSRHDLYSHIMNFYGSDLRTLIKGCYKADGSVLFPQKFTLRYFERLKTADPLRFYAQFLNDPLSSEITDFDERRLRKCHVDGQGNIVLTRLNGQVRWHWSALDRVITADPNGGSKTAPDEAAVICTGMTPDEDACVLEAKSGRPTHSEFVEWIFDMCVRWRPRVVGIEEAGQQNTLFYFNELCRKKGVMFQAVPLRPDNLDKERRIRTLLEPVVNSGRLYVQEGQKGLVAQLNQFPDLALWDLVDALAYAFKLLFTPMAQEEMERSDDLALALAGSRHPRTGY